MPNRKQAFRRPLRSQAPRLQKLNYSVASTGSFFNFGSFLVLGCGSVAVLSRFAMLWALQHRVEPASHELCRHAASGNDCAGRADQAV